MYIKKCTMENLLDCVKFYEKEVKYLEETVNYPRWERGVYPCELTVVEKIEMGEQYIGYIGPFVGGAFVFNEDLFRFHIFRSLEILRCFQWLS